MKVRLLKKLRREAVRQLCITSVTTTNGVITGMTMCYYHDKYSKLFSSGDTKKSVMKKVEHIYINDFLNGKRK